MTKWMWVLVVAAWIVWSAPALAEDGGKAIYISPEGIEFASNSKQWDTDRLKGLYELLQQCAHGIELQELKAVVLNADKSVGRSGYRVGHYNPDTRTITLFEVEQIPVERTLIHEYGHHFTYYWLNRKEGITPQQLTSDSQWSQIRELDGYPVRWAGSALPYRHHWDPGEIMAEDYVLLFGITAMAPPASGPQIANFARPENEYIPPPADLPALREYWASISGLDARSPLATPDLISLSSYPLNDGETQAYRLLFHSAATADDMALEYAVQAIGYSKDFILPQKMTVDFTSSASNVIEMKLDLSELMEAGFGDKMNIQIWAYDRQSKHLSYTPFYENWFQFEAYAPKAVSPPFEQSGLAAILSKEGMDKWPLTRMMVNERAYHPKGKARKAGSTVYVPLSFLCEQLGGTVEVNEEESVHTYHMPSQNDLTVGPKQATLNGKQLGLKYPVRRENGSYWVSLEDAALMMAVRARWDQKTGHLFIASLAAEDVSSFIQQ